MISRRESLRGAVASCLSLSLCLSACPSCTSARPVPWHPATAESWRQLSGELSQERRSRPQEPWSAGLRITMREPSSGRVIDGRGAIAVQPGQAVRMILTASRSSIEKT